ncbi:MAG TPA: 2-oxoglutarate dehydrogenase E1 component [Candidatus Binatia bacterium]|jgi:2-oxoglutarate dehydrogenase E1 component|nr:2-oxoglutarate dehydrogenase E1 component [Candidatus Binatia bacterium]
MNGIEGLALANKDYVEEQYRRWKADPSSVDESWTVFFAGFELALDGGGNGTAAAVTNGASAAHAERVVDDVAPVLGVYDLVHSYRELGHLQAYLNPLAPKPPQHQLLSPSEFGFTEADLDRVVESGSFLGCTTCKLGDLVAQLQATYCGTIGVEYLHIPDRAQRSWLQERMEPMQNHPALTADDRIHLLDTVIWAEGFEQFLQIRYPTAKRFSLEGGEALVPILDALIEEGGALGAQEMVFGMPHRGRLNILANVLRKPYEMILSEFEGSLLSKEITGDGDVKYHLGYSRDHTTRAGQKVHLSLSPNPSHLEWVNPVIEGMVRAKQNHLGDTARSRVVPILMHGDAAFTGQGVVAETLWLSELEAYRTGGTIHIIVNNQIGFTTSPESYRFTPYPSDVAKVIQAPVFHVNGDDPEAAVQAARLAIGFRQQFKKDVIIHLVCYRRHGHNELDDPTFTQPVMYKKIAQHPTPLTVYRDRVVADGVVTADEADRRASEFRELLSDAQSYARDFMPRQQVFAFGGLWKGLGWAGDDWSADTRVARETLEEIAGGFGRVPEGFTPNPKVIRLLETRTAMVSDTGQIDWGCAEALAIGSLLVEGTAVRMTGQDTGRGTFSHRHAVLHDTETDATFVPLANMRPDQATFLIADSMLSEAAVLGFEFGFSCADPRKLVVWEAQFGDFGNGAQVIIDQFIASSESKWQRTSGLVMLLPHGYEGQGPEHSSARLERYLQLCAENNLQVCNFSTPAQYFHALRRQMHRNFRKPLIVMSPKSLLRHKAAVSSLRDLTDGAFQPVIDDPAAVGAPEMGVTVNRPSVSRILLCSGKIYYALMASRRERANDNVAIVRVEQLYPFARTELTAILAAYPQAEQVFWVQEEPANMGAWRFMAPLLQPMLGTRTLTYVGRRPAASPATGSYKVHQAEETDLVNRAFSRT